MNYRINTRSVALVLILVLVAIGIFIYTLISAPTTTEVTQSEDQTQEEIKEDLLITAKHQYRDGIHIIAGKVEVPTVCHRLVTEPFFTDSERGKVEIRFSTLLEGEECVKEPFEVPFRVMFEAQEDVDITALWNGTPVRLNLIPVGPNEELDDEVYIKG